MQLQHYIWIIRRKFWLILLGVILCTGATAAIAFKKAPVYEASATIEVNTPDNDVYGNQALAVTYALQVTDPAVFQEVVKELPGVTLAQLQNDVSASPIDGTQLIDISVDVSSPQLATAIANKIAQVFINQKLTSATARQQTILTQLSTQLATAQTKMNQDQAQVTLLETQGASQEQIQEANNTLANDQSTYESLMTNYNTVAMQKAMITGSLSIEQLATLPDQPSGTSRTLTIGIALVMSLLLMLLVVFLLDWLDATIKTPEDVGRLAQLDALGSIPLQEKGLHPSPVFPNEEDSDVLEQTFAVIGTNLQALYKGQRALLVTGLRSGAGASTTATRMALTLAQAGLRVFLVDANLRKPSLHHEFRVVNTRGLANGLADAMALQEQPSQIYNWLGRWATSVPNLWLWPGGPVSISPLTVLRSAELRKIVHWLLQEPGMTPQRPGPAIDVVIFDAPALLEEADAMALALLCDSTVLVINAAKERKETLKKAELTLERLGAPTLGVVVNRQEATHRSYLYTRQPELDLAASHAQKKSEKYPPLTTSSAQPAASAVASAAFTAPAQPPSAAAPAAYALMAPPPLASQPLASQSLANAQLPLTPPSAALHPHSGMDKEVTALLTVSEPPKNTTARRPFRTTLSRAESTQPEEYGKRQQ